MHSQQDKFSNYTIWQMRLKQKSTICYSDFSAAEIERIKSDCIFLQDEAFVADRDGKIYSF